MRHVYAIAKRELRSYFVSPIAYAALTAFVLLSGYFFNSMVVYYIRQGSLADRQVQAAGRSALQLDVPTAILQNYFTNQGGFVLLLILPLLTMGLLTDERRKGTLELLLTSPIRSLELTLRGLAELLGRDIPADDHRRRYVDTMLQSIDRLNRLIEDLLLFSSPRPTSSDMLDMASTVAETVSLAQVGVASRPVALRIGSPSAEPLIVRGNRERLIQVLTNIVLNATQAAPDGGTVTVRTEQRDGLAVVTVHNTGSYIPPQVRRQLFVPFFTTKPTGTGLGLAIARQIVTSMDGRIDVESDQDTGTTFTVELPLAARDQPAAALAG